MQQVLCVLYKMVNALFGRQGKNDHVVPILVLAASRLVDSVPVHLVLQPVHSLEFPVCFVVEVKS